jgi:hypothetical protein
MSKAAHVASESFMQLKVSATPTIIVTNKKGLVKDFWIGIIPEDKEDLIIRSVNAVSKGGRRV